MGTEHYDFTYLDGNSNVDIAGDTATFLDEIDSTIYRIHHGYVGFIGDSYCADGTIPNLVASSLGKHVINQAVSGAGFCNEGTTGADSFIHQAEKLKANAHYDDIDQIIIYGGVNDLNETAGNINTAMANLCTYLKTNFAEAKINIFLINATPYYGYDKLAGRLESTSTVAKRAGNVSVDMNAHLWFFYNSSLISADGLHPTDAGKKYIAGCITSSLNGNSSVIRNFDAPIETGAYINRSFTMRDNIIYAFANVHANAAANGFTNLVNLTDPSLGLQIPFHTAATFATGGQQGNNQCVFVSTGKKIVLYNQGAARENDYYVTAIFPVCRI